MSQVITATYDNGVLKPDQPLDLKAGARVRMYIEPLETEAELDKAWQEFDQLCEEISIDSNTPRLTRDQLHERS